MPRLRCSDADDARIAAALRGTMRGLDGLRGLAIAGVLACHFANAWPGGTRLDRALVEAVGLGWSGVDLFFVLSGFLITGILVDSVGREGWWRSFVARRALRIFPLYYLALAVFWVAGPAAGLVDPWTLRRWGWWYWSYLGNWAFPAHQVIPPLSHFWSLAVEEQFYLAWPLVVWAAHAGAPRVAPGERARRRLGWAALALVAAGPLLRAVIVRSGWPPGTAYRITPGRLDALALGAALAVLLRAPAGRALAARGWRVAAAAGAAGFLALGAWRGGFDMHDPALEVWAHTALALGFGGLLAGVVATEGTRHPLQRGLGARPLQALGRWSYGLYVVHYFVHLAALQALRARPWGAALLATRAGYLAYAGAGVAVTVGLAAASHRFFERPFLALKGRFSPGARVAAVP